MSREELTAQIDGAVNQLSRLRGSEPKGRPGDRTLPGRRAAWERACAYVEAEIDKLKAELEKLP